MDVNHEVIVYPNGKTSKEDLVTTYGHPKVAYSSFAIFNLHDDQIKQLKENGHNVHSVPNRNELHFGLGKLSKEHFIIKDEVDEEKKVYLIQFVGPIKDEWRSALLGLGIRLYGYIHPYTLFAYLSPSMAKELSLQKLRVDGERVIEWVGRYHATVKRDALVRSVRPDEDIVVHYFPWSDHPEKQSYHQSNSVNPSDLASREDVIFVESRPIPKPLNNQAKIVTDTNVAYLKNVIGTNQIIAITDTGIYSAHEAFGSTGKIVSTIDIAGDSANGTLDGVGHGTHVACSSCGDAPPYLVSNLYDGQAMGAKLVNVKVFDNSGVWKGVNEYTFWQQGYQAGARINNNSWGSTTNGVYSSADHNADQIMADNSDYLLVIANGNSGSTGMTVGTPAIAKNVISVGALMTNTPEDVADFSSRGPTADGRIKPDILAPGAPICSAQTGTTGGYIVYQGTSMATPQITGIAAIVREFFHDGLYGGTAMNVSGILTKALIINGAQEINGVGSDILNEGKFPNNSQGWGLANVARTLPYSGGLRTIKVWDVATSPSTGTTWSQSFNVTTISPEIKVTLAWIDSAATPGTTISLANNLNLQVIGPDGSIFLGNNLINRNPGYSVTGGSSDTTNTVEGVHLIPNKSYPGTLPTGTYQVNVIGQNVINPNLGFALVAGIHNNVPRAVVMGDYTDNIKSLVEESGYMVDAYLYNDYSFVPYLSQYSLVVFNLADNQPIFDTILANAGTQTGIVFLTSYQNSQYGLGVTSARQGNPKALDQQYDLGPVKLKISGSHSITRGLGLNNIYTIINGGDDDYQGYSGFVGSQTICTNATGTGLSGMVGVVEATATTSRRVYATSFGVQYYTNLIHWTSDGRMIFKRIVSWAGGLLA